MVRQERLHVRVSAHEYAAYEGGAKSMVMSLSDWVREILDAELKRQLPCLAKAKTEAGSVKCDLSTGHSGKHSHQGLEWASPRGSMYEEDYEYDVWMPVDPASPPGDLMQYALMWSDRAESIIQYTIHHGSSEDWAERCDPNRPGRHATHVCYRRMWRVPPGPTDAPMDRGHPWSFMTDAERKDLMARDPVLARTRMSPDEIRSNFGKG